MSGYCLIAPGHPVHGHYHDHEYGFPQRDERELFERLLLEINQAGLSWETILKKREGFRAAYSGFDVDTVAAYGERDIERLLNDAGIIRNRLKVHAAVHNAQVIQQLRQLRGVAGRAPPAGQGGVGGAVQEDVPFHRRRDHRRVPDEPGLPARRAQPGLPGIRPAATPACRPTVGAYRMMRGAYTPM